MGAATAAAALAGAAVAALAATLAAALAAARRDEAGVGAPGAVEGALDGADGWLARRRALVLSYGYQRCAIFTPRTGSSQCTFLTCICLVVSSFRSVVRKAN